MGSTDTDDLAAAIREFESALPGYRGTVHQDGMLVAAVSGPTMTAVVVEIEHYAAVYRQDGPVTVKIRRERVPATAKQRERT